MEYKILFAETLCAVRYIKYFVRRSREQTFIKCRKIDNLIIKEGKKANVTNKF